MKKMWVMTRAEARAPEPATFSAEVECGVRHAELPTNQLGEDGGLRMADGGVHATFRQGV